MTYTGLITTAGAILLQSVAFKRVSAQDASIIIASEPVWAALVAYFAMGETMNSVDMTGAAFILMASMVKELDLDGIATADTSGSNSDISANTGGKQDRNGQKNRSGSMMIE
mgnify:CR=1 FL=1